ncbi:hypothetical protein SIN8267_02042 [Sinobacterium norvegicum]|uniref:OmpR/PhoB-type domain-containing protein n=1 Tax=Sinobacterium norvegicum TaxID=1641715 RepID=A0ABM9AFE7_9GAMM|nr:winged helix-turn-helix domain-containing protein [Sinobacterium norvegicum]CAH0991927.1 hypothetical protein SIN8267_02042 [Sinobacterium norvegicum]
MMTNKTMSELRLQPPCYQIENFFYSTASGVLRVDGKYSQLRAREAALLQLLIESYPEIVSRDQLDESVWKESYVTNATINQTIKGLRRSLLDDNRTIIRTIPKQGYRLSIEPLIFDIEPVPPIDIPPAAVFQSEPAATKDNDIPAATPPPASEQKAFNHKRAVTAKIVLAAVVLFVVGFFVSHSLSPLFYPEKTIYQVGDDWLVFPTNAAEQALLPIEEDGIVRYFVDDAPLTICQEDSRGMTCHVE